MFQLTVKLKVGLNQLSIAIVHQECSIGCVDLAMAAPNDIIANKFNRN